MDINMRVRGWVTSLLVPMKDQSLCIALAPKPISSPFLQTQSLPLTSEVLAQMIYLFKNKILPICIRQQGKQELICSFFYPT